MPWFLLGVAIITEVIGTIALKISNGFTAWLPSIIVVAGYGCSFWFLSLSLKFIQVGVAYAIWAGVGTALIAIAGAIIFKEPFNILKVVSITLIVLGVIGLNWAQNNSV